MLFLAGLTHVWAAEPVLIGVQDADHPPRDAITALGGRVVRCYHSSRVCLVEGVEPETLRSVPGVRHAERDRPMQSLAAGSTASPTDGCPDPWEIDAIAVAEVWPEVCGVEAPVIAVQDSGFRLDHRELQGHIAQGWDYGNGDDTPEVAQQSGVPEHGTFVAGIVAASADDFGRTGIAPEGSLFLQKIADQYGALYFSYAIEAMDDLAMNHPEVGVLNYSIAATDAPPAFSDAVEGLLAADILVVTAAANCLVPNCLDSDNDATPVYPANYDFPHIVSVSSLKPDGSLDPMSHYGRETVTLAAPGADICSLGIASDSALLTSSGTSYAAPVVAGTAALLREASPRLTAPEVATVLERSCSLSAALSDKVRCGGALSAERALAMPVISLQDIDALDVTPRAELVLTLDSRAAGGEILVVLTHPDWLVVDDESAIPFIDGDSLPFPADRAAVDSGTWLVYELPADTTVELDISVRAIEQGSGEITLELLPYSGTLAGLAPSPIPIAVEGEPAPHTGKPSRKDGCGCASTRTPLHSLWLLLLPWLLTRRR